MVLGSDVVEQFSIATVFHDEEDSVRRFNDFIELNDTRVPYYF